MGVYGRGSIVLLGAVAWLGIGATITGSGTVAPPQATAQGSLTPPAGQPRVTAPGGLRGRALRRSHAPRRHRLRHR